LAFFIQKSPIMKKIYTLFLFLFYINAILFAQKHDNVWITGGDHGWLPNLPEAGFGFLDFSKKDTIVKYSPEAKGELNFSKYSSFGFKIIRNLMSCVLCHAVWQGFTFLVDLISKNG
jgi:hypothetical protein